MKNLVTCLALATLSLAAIMPNNFQAPGNIAYFGGGNIATDIGNQFYGSNNLADGRFNTMAG